MQEIVKNNKVNEEKDIVKKQTGITLIALVITIIVLLILAGVSIATLTGDNGILKQANQAKENTNSKAAWEKVQVEALGSIDKSGKFNKETFKDNLKTNLKLSDNDIVDNADGTITVKIDGYDVTVNGTTGEVRGVAKANTETPSSGVKPGTVVSKTEKNNYSDGTKTATVPQGFTVSGLPEEQIIANGLVIYDIPEAEVSNVDWSTAATKYNQFVWIPVASAQEYQRGFSYPNDFSSSDENTFTDTGYLPTDIQPETDEDDATNNETAERNAVLKYNGFYIARYEAGDENSNVVSKQNARVYVNETQESFKTIGKTMYGESSTNVKSAMCSGIQWDMVMKFVDGKTDGNGNAYDVRTANSNRHKGENIGAEVTGKNIADKVQNIYDLEGNCIEYVAEKNNASSPFVYRGGSYDYGYGYSRASKRGSSSGSAGSNLTFRPVLYVK